VLADGIVCGEGTCFDIIYCSLSKILGIKSLKKSGFYLLWILAEEY
jgi:hypothetical protein